MPQVAVTQAAPPPPFRQSTRQQVVPVDSASFTAFGQTKTIRLPVTGFLQRIFLRWSGTMTTGAGTPASNTWAAYPPSPSNVIAKVRLTTNDAVPFYDISGYGLYLLNRFSRFGYLTDAYPYEAVASPGATSSSTIGTLEIPLSGSIAASTAYNVAGWSSIEAATDDYVQFGLILLQTQQGTVNLDVTLCNQSDITALTGVTLTPAITVQPYMEVFSVPNDPGSFPDQSYFRQVVEEFQPISATGDNPYNPPIGNIYERLLFQMENNNAQMAVTALNGIDLRFASNVTPYSETYLNNWIRNRRFNGVGLPDGCFGYDFTDGFGLPGVFNVRDLFNSARQSYLQVVPNIAGGTTLTNARMRIIRDQLVARG